MDKKEQELHRIRWITKAEIAPVTEEHRYEFFSFVFAQNFERMVLASKYGFLLLLVVVFCVHVLNAFGMSDEQRFTSLSYQIPFLVSTALGYLVGRRIDPYAESTALITIFAWSTVFRTLFTLIGYGMIWNIGRSGGSISSTYALFLAVMTLGLYTDKRYSILLALFNGLAFTIITFSLHSAPKVIVEDLFTAYSLLIIVALSSKNLYDSVKKEFAALKQIDEQRRIAEELNAKLSSANLEIEQQIEVLSEQAREIEIVNTVLQEKSLELEDQRNSLAVANWELAEKNVHLQQLNAEKNEFLGIAAHDLKNPLASIVMTAQMIARFIDRMSHEKLLEKLQTIEFSATYMRGIIVNLLDVNAIESGSFYVNKEHIDVAKEVKKITDSYIERAQMKNIAIEYRENPPTLAVADENALPQVLENLISNAVKYSPHNKNIYISVEKLG